MQLRNRNRTASWIMSAVIVPGLLHAAPWARTYGGTGHEFAAQVTPSADGTNWLQASTRSFGAGGVDGLFARLNSSGKAVWAKSLGGKGDDFLTIERRTNGYFVGGYTTSYGSGNPAATNYNVLYATFDASWNAVAEKVWGGAQDEIAEYTRTSDGGHLFRGSTASYVTGTDTRDLLLFKVSPAGVMTWRKVYSVSDDDVYGETAELADGYVLSFTTADGDAALIKTSKTTGSVLWRRKIHTATGILGRPRLAKTADGGILAAMSQSTGFDTRLLLLKLSGGTGVIAWKKSFRHSSSGVFPESVIERANTSLLLGGNMLEPSGTNFINHALVLKLSSTGAILAQTRLQVPNRHLTGDVSADGALWSGVSFDPVKTNFDAVCAKLNKTTYRPVWARSYGGPNPETGIAFKQGTNVVFSGHTESLGGGSPGKGNIFAMLLSTTGATPGAVTDLDLQGEAASLISLTPSVQSTTTFTIASRSSTVPTSIILTLKSVSL